MSPESNEPKNPMTLRELIEALQEFDDDILDEPVRLQDQIGVVAWIEEVSAPNGVFIIPTRDFEEDPKWYLNNLAGVIHEEAVKKGFWDKEDRNVGEMLMLVVSELAEALEEHRSGMPAFYREHPPTPLTLVAEIGDVEKARLLYLEYREKEGHLPKPEGVAVEAVDAIIRLLDFLSSLNVDIDGILEEKFRYNQSRPPMHGKKY